MTDKPNKLIVEGELTWSLDGGLFINREYLYVLINAIFEKLEGSWTYRNFGRVRITIERLQDE